MSAPWSYPCLPTLRRDTQRRRQDARVGWAGLAAPDRDPRNAALRQLAWLQDELHEPAFARFQRHSPEAFQRPHVIVLDVKLHHLLAVQLAGIAHFDGDRDVVVGRRPLRAVEPAVGKGDRKSTRLNSS